jgi:3-hydroxyacyl-CoA dehydrogenase
MTSPLPPIGADAPIAVIGAGLIGMSWAALFSGYGHPVRVWDVRPDVADTLTPYVARAHAALRELGQLAATPGAITVTMDLGEAIVGARFVQENAPEKLELKRDLYALIAQYIEPDAVLASSTSSIAPSLLQEGAPFAERLLVGHPFNPPHLMPVVEIVRGAATTAEAAELAFQFYQSLGRVPLRLHKEVVGHLGNRLQAALWREAIDAVASGLASLEDVDAMLTHGLGLRWAVAGPHFSFHLAGGAGGYDNFIGHLGPAFEAQWRDLRTSDLTPELRARLVEEMQQLAGDRSVAAWETERDQRLVGIMQARAALGGPLGRKA